MYCLLFANAICHSSACCSLCHLQCAAPPPLPSISHRRCLSSLVQCLFMPKIRRTANAAYKATTPKCNWGRGWESRDRLRLHSPTRKHRHSPSPHQAWLPIDHPEKRSRGSPRRARQDCPEFFQSGTGPHGGVCATCLSCHDHTYSKCDGVKLWDGSPGAAWKNEQGRLVADDGWPLCFNWQVPRGCSLSNHTKWHRCSGCGKSNHGAQTCPRAQKA